MLPPPPPALRLELLSARDFRNFERVEIEPDPSFTVLEGDNGQGKSNLLEAIGLVGWQRSFRGARAEDMIRHGATSAHVEARLSAPPDPGHVVAVDLSPGGRCLRLDGKRPATPAAYFGVVQMVLFHPGELALVQGGPAERRALLDRVLYQTDPLYPSLHRDFRLALKSRNRLLKQGARPELVRAFDHPLADAAVRVVAARGRLVDAIGPQVVSAYRAITGGVTEAGIEYRPHGASATVDALLEDLDRSRGRDFARGQTGPGPQGDDLAFSLDGRAARMFGSQGQQRALVLAVKCAEVAVLCERTGRLPLLLLDDVSSELDVIRSALLFSRLADGGGQVILTTTRAEILPLARPYRLHRVTAGVVSS